MSRYRVRIALLSLGVLFGYGSAVARYYHGPFRGHGSFCSHAAEAPATGARGEGAPKPVQ